MELACVLEPFKREFNLDYLKKQKTEILILQKPEENWKKTFWSMSIGNGDRADRLHQRNMPEQQE